MSNPQQKIVMLLLFYLPYIAIYFVTLDIDVTP